MSQTTYAGFVALFPLLWSGVIDRVGLFNLGQIAMLLLMGLVMVRRDHQQLQRT